MSETFATPDEHAFEGRASDLSTTLGESLSAQGGESLFGGLRTQIRLGAYETAAGHMVPGLNVPDVPQPQDLANFEAINAQPDVPIADAHARVKQEGVDSELKLPDQPTIRPAVLDLMIAHARERQQYNAAVARGPRGFLPGTLGFVTQIGAGMIDPVNLAAFSVPVLGEARAGRILYAAGDSVLARAGAKFAIGGLQGGVGSAVLEPANWWLHTQDGQDYTFADTLRSIVMGIGMGGSMHAAIGGYGDLRARRAGRALPGSPQALLEQGLMAGQHVPAAALGEAGVPAEELVPGVARPATPSTFETTIDINGERRTMSGAYDPAEVAAAGEPADFSDSDERFKAAIALLEARGADGLDMADTFADLPPPVREDLVHATAADMINGHPARGGEVLAIAARQDPRIAESMGIDAWHGSPHDFDRFDASKIGAGEGAQSYGHGLYFAENPNVADSYRARLAQENDAARAWLEDAGGDRRKALENFDRANPDITEDETKQQTRQALEKPGKTYKVRIKVDQAHMLDWDKPLKDEPEILAKFRKAVGDDVREAFEANVQHGISGANAYHNYIGDGRGGAAASKALHDVGIRGIKYLDQGSRFFPDQMERELADATRARDAELDPAKRASLDKYLVSLQGELQEAKSRTQTRNFVVFNDHDIEITHKNGEPVTREELRQEAQAKHVMHGAGEPISLADVTPEKPLHVQWMANRTGSEGHNDFGNGTTVRRLADGSYEATSGASVLAKGTRAEVEAYFNDPARARYRRVVPSFDSAEARAFGALDDEAVYGPPADRHGGLELLGPDPRGNVLPGPPAARGPRARDEKTYSLLEHLAHRGGLAPDPELAAIFGGKNPFVPGFGRLIRRTGMSLDRARESAVEAGYLHDAAQQHGGVTESTVNHLLEAIDGEARGNRVYRAGEEREAPVNREENLHRINSDIDAEFAANGLDPKSLPDKTRARVVEIMDREGVRDPLEAYERAVLEEDRNAVEAGRAAPAEPIAGWDVPDDAGAAPRAGGRGRDQQSGAGAAASGARGNDRAPRVDLDAWRRLGEPRPDPDAAADVAASRAADKEPPPASVDAAKAVSAAEAEAAKAEALVKDIDAQLTDKEREAFRDALAQVADDKAARDTIVRDGAACLLEAAA